VLAEGAPLIPGLMIHDSQPRLGGSPSNPKLLAMLNALIAKFGGGSARKLHDTAMYYVKRGKKIYPATNPEETKKFDATLLSPKVRAGVWLRLTDAGRTGL
jgi:hypothetical protein